MRNSYYFEVFYRISEFFLLKKRLTLYIDLILVTEVFRLEIYTPALYYRFPQHQLIHSAIVLLQFYTFCTIIEIFPKMYISLIESLVYFVLFFSVNSDSIIENVDRVKRSDIDLQTCIENFNVHRDKIIRTQDSQNMGAKYLNEIDLGTREECLRLCCETENCDVFVFEEKVRVHHIYIMCYKYIN